MTQRTTILGLAEGEHLHDVVVEPPWIVVVRVGRRPRADPRRLGALALILLQWAATIYTKVRPAGLRHAGGDPLVGAGGEDVARARGRIQAARIEELMRQEGNRAYLLEGAHATLIDGDPPLVELTATRRATSGADGARERRLLEATGDPPERLLRLLHPAGTPDGDA